MDTTVFVAVLGAAMLHAGWNLIVKVGLDRRASILLLAIVQAIVALPLLAFAPIPDMNAWPWIAASAALHAGYKIFLGETYRHADLSQAYPIARGGATLFVAMISAIALGVVFSVSEVAALLAISAGIFVMGWKGTRGSPMTRLGLFFALGTAGITASYTLVDGIGARIAGTATGYTLWMVIGDALIMIAYAGLTRGADAFRPLPAAWKPGLAAGSMSLGSYWIAVWAFTQAPIALVAALRETSILFAVLLAAIVARESVAPARWAAAFLIVLGIAAMRL